MKRVTLIVVLCWYIVSTESASISMQLSSPNIQNGSSLRVNVTFSPPLGNERFGRFGLSFAKQWKEFIIPDKSILLWNKTINRISFHKNLPASEKARIQIVSTNNPTSIDISSITFADDNRWLQAFVEYNDSSGINATNTLKAIATNARIKVYTPLVLYGMSPSILSREGNSANLKCTASARPAPSITWHYNSAAINATISTTTVTTTISNVTSVLKISSLTASANGQQVTCSATHHPYSPTINRTTTFNVQYKPINTIVSVLPSNPRLNQLIQVSCTAVANPDARLFHIYANETIIGYTFPGRSNLTLNVTESLKYAVYFKCTPQNFLGLGVQGQQLVVVQGIPDIIARPPITLDVKEGTNLQLQITMGGSPKPSADFRWLHLTGSSPTNVPSVQLYPFVYSSTYTLNNIDASYCGRILQTTLKNSIGSSSDTASTNVTVLLKLDMDFGLKAGRIGGAKCIEVKWNKVQAGACYVKYEVVLKNASGNNEYVKAGYNIGEMTMCSFLNFSSVTDVQLTVSFKSTSRYVTTKVSGTQLTTPIPTPTSMTPFYMFSSVLIALLHW